MSSRLARIAWVTALVACALTALGCGRSRPPAPKESVFLPHESYPGEDRFVSELFDPERAPSLLEGPERDGWQKPERLVEALELKPGDVAADIGTGSGYLLPHLSRAVGPHGTVYAEEIQKEFLPSLRRRAEKLRNVKVVMGTAADPQLPDGVIDLMVMLTVYHEVKEPVTFLTTLRRLAKPTTHLAIIDFDGKRKGDFPAPTGHDVPEEAVVAEATKAGWKLLHRHEFLGSQFFLVFTPEIPPLKPVPSG